MTRARRILWTAAFAVLLTLGAISTARASTLEQRYPADELGVIHDPQIDALASSLVGWPVTVDCTPDDPDSAGRTYFSGYSDDDGASWTYDPPTSFELNGSICGALDRILNPPAGYFRHPTGIYLEQIKPLPRPRSRGGKATLGRAPVQSVELVLGDERIDAAAFAILTIRHESLHVRLAGQTPFVSVTLPDGTESAPALDEGVVECDASRNLWPAVVLVTPIRWLRKALYASAMQAAQDDDVPAERTVC